MLHYAMLTFFQLQTAVEPCEDVAMAANGACGYMGTSSPAEAGDAVRHVPRTSTAARPSADSPVAGTSSVSFPAEQNIKTIENRRHTSDREHRNYHIVPFKKGIGHSTFKH